MTRRVVLVALADGRRWEIVAAASYAASEAARLLADGATTVRCYEGRRMRWERASPLASERSAMAMQAATDGEKRSA